MTAHILTRFHEIMNNLPNASLEDVSELLNYFNGKPVLIDGANYHPFTEPIMAAQLNARYRELTGKDHPVFLEQAPKVIDGLLWDKEMLLSAGAYSPLYFNTLEQLKGNFSNESNPSMEIVNGYQRHIISRTYEIVNNLPNASLEDVSELLNYYNGKPVLIDGAASHPFNDPAMAAEINARYRELTGKDHPVFLEQAPKVIDRLLREKEMLLSIGAYKPEYFENLKQIKGYIQYSGRQADNSITGASHSQR